MSVAADRNTLGEFDNFVAWLREMLNENADLKEQIKALETRNKQLIGQRTRCRTNRSGSVGRTAADRRKRKGEQ
jgi:hypothetical protein